jgi:hypothetical protein
VTANQVVGTSVGHTGVVYTDLPSVADDEWLRLELTAATLHFIERNRAVWFPTLGIFFPEVKTAAVIRHLGSRLVVQKETTRTANFEKCSELVAYQRERFPTVVELPELAERVFSKASETTRNQLSHRHVRGRLQSLISAVRRDVLNRGSSTLLPGLGTLYALHNRQGETEGDWYAGADLFIVDRYSRTLHVEPPTFLERPSFRDSFELLEAAYGIGELTDEVTVGEFPVRVKSFKIPATDKGTSSDRYLLATDGVRRLSKVDNAEPGELLLELQSVEGLSWGRRLLVNLCKADQGHFAASVRKGTMIELPKAQHPTLSPGTRRTSLPITTIIVAPFHRASAEHRCDDGVFTYRLLVGITADEAALSEKIGYAPLMAMLERRGHASATKLIRPSVLLRSCFEAAAVEKATPMQGTAAVLKEDRLKEKSTTESGARRTA